MRLAIFGSTGLVGRELLAQALASDHEVKTLVRDPERLALQHPALATIVGDAKDLAAVEATVTDCEAVLSTLGARRGDATDTRRVGTTNIITAMHEHGVRRLIAMGVFFLDFPGDPHNIGRTLVRPVVRLLGVSVDDVTGIGPLIQSSGLDWTVVRAPQVVSGNGHNRVRTGTLKLGPTSKVTAANVATFMLDCLEHHTYISQAPMICDRRSNPSQKRPAPATRRPRSPGPLAR